MTGSERSPRAALAVVVGVTVVLSVLLSLVHLPSAVLFASLVGGMAHALTSPTPLELPSGLFRIAQGTIGVVIGAVVSLPALERIGHDVHSVHPSAGALAVGAAQLEAGHPRAHHSVHPSARAVAVSSARSTTARVLSR